MYRPALRPSGAPSAYAGGVPPLPPARGLTLFVPRAIPVVILSLGTLWTVPLLAALATARPVHPGFQLLNAVIAVVLVGFGLDTALMKVVLTPEEIRMRRGLRTRTRTWDQVKGVSLRTDEGTPRLRVVTRDDDDLAMPAWSLRARHADGEVETAAAALPRFGVAHGVRTRVRTLGTGPSDRRPA